MAIAVLCAKREPHTEGLRKQCEVIAGPPHMTQDFAAKCTSYCFLTGLVGGAVIVPALPPVWWGRDIRVRGPNGLTLSLGAWLKWGSAVRILLLLLVVVVVVIPPSTHPATHRGQGGGNVLHCYIYISYVYILRIEHNSVRIYSCGPYTSLAFVGRSGMRGTVLPVSWAGREPMPEQRHRGPTGRCHGFG